MKKSLTILTIAILAIVAFASCVNAASVQASTTNVNVGDTVTVTVKTDKQFEGTSFTLTFDASKFEYQSASCVDANGATLNFENNTSKAAEGEVFIQAYSGSLTSDTVVVTFKALAATEGASFDVKNLILSGTDAEELTNNPVTIAVATDNGGQQGGNTEGQGNQGEGTGTSTQGSETPVDKNGNPIKGLPNAGTPIFVGAIALIVVAGAVLVIRNRK